METRDKHHTRTRKGTVFMGTGMGTGNFTRGLPVSHPKYDQLNHLPIQTPSEIEEILGQLMLYVLRNENW